MAHYMLRWQFSAPSATALVAKPQDRTGPAKELIESCGGKLHSYFFELGHYDGLGICEFPDTTSAAAASLIASSSGAFTRFETTALMTAKEAEAAMKKAHDKVASYKPPKS